MGDHQTTFAMLQNFYRLLYARLSGSGIHRFALARRVDALLGARLRHHEAELNGHRLLLDPQDSLRLSIIGAYEPAVTRLVEKVIRPGDVVVDIGAHIGYFTLHFARLVGETGRVYAFEPDPENFALLQTNVRANGYTNVVLEPMAVSDRSGTFTLYRAENNPADHRIYDPQEARQPLAIPTVSLDAYFSDQASARVDLVKVDVQGAEEQVVLGMAGMLARNPSLKLITEFWPFGLQAAGGSAPALLNLLEQHRFNFYPMDNEWKEQPPWTAQKLLETYTSARQNFTNLFCARVG